MELPSETHAAVEHYTAQVAVYRAANWQRFTFIYYCELAANANLASLETHLPFGLPDGRRPPAGDFTQDDILPAFKLHLSKRQL